MTIIVILTISYISFVKTTYFAVVFLRSCFCTEIVKLGFKVIYTVCIFHVIWQRVPFIDNPLTEEVSPNMSMGWLLELHPPPTQSYSGF